MTPTLIEQFRQRYEFLKGEVHIVPDETAAATQVHSIIHGDGVERIACAGLPAAIQTHIDFRCAEENIRVLKPPYTAEDLPGAIDKAPVGVSFAQHAIAQSGTLIEFATDDSFRLVSALPRTHVGIFYASALLDSFESAAPIIRSFFETNAENAVVSFISGPSRTGDIEMILTLGVHGPEIAHAVIIENNPQES